MSKLKINGIPSIPGVDFEYENALSLKPDKPFPDKAFDDNGGEIAFASVKASKEFEIDGAKGIKFGIDAGGYAALGVYRETDKLLAALEKEELSEQLRNLLNLQITNEENLLALRWGYGFGASIDGKVGLFSAANPVKLNFGVSGKTIGRSVLLHSTGRDKSVAASVKETLATWRVPRQVKTFDDLKPKTTVVFETMGNLKLALGVEYGYDFNWVRDSVKLGNLSGDLGLKIELGLKAQFGFSAVGNYAIALSRETDAKTIRAQVYNMKQNGWSFSFDGGISGQFQKTDLVPEKLDDFIKGVFNLNGSQVLKDFDRWTDPNIDIKGLLGPGLENYARELIKKVTGIDPDKELKKATDAMKSLISQWNALPHEISSYLYGLLGNDFGLKAAAAIAETPGGTSEALTKKTKDAISKKLNAELAKLRDFLKQIIDLKGSDQDLTAAITKHLQSVDFFSNPVGKWLGAASGQEILSLLLNIKSEKKGLAALAVQTLGLLDGGDVEAQLKALQNELTERLSLDKIINLNPDEWLQKRLAEFLDKSKITDELENIRKAVIETRKRVSDFYEKGYAALLKKYSFNVNYAFQKSTGNSALLDVTLDFKGENAKPAAIYLAEILDGNFQNVFTATGEKCLTINQAVLTHEINRNVHVGVNIPYFSATLDHITKSVAGKKFVETADGKLWVYYLSAEDIVKKKKSLSRLAISAELTERDGIRKFGEQDNELDYSFLYGKKEVDRKYIDIRYDFAASTYLRSAFPGGSFDKYLTDIDKFLDTNGYPASDEFGNVLTSLKVSVPGSIMKAWEDVPEDFDTAQFYKDLSAVIQTTMREWIPPNYIQDVKQYKRSDLIFPLLAYQSLDPVFDKRIKEGVFYWSFSSDSKRKELFNSINVQNNLRRILRDIQTQTTDDRYRETGENIQKILGYALTDGKSRFKSLCDLEEDLIKGVVKTAKAFIQFNTEPDPKKKVKALAEFGAAFTDTFNDEIGHIGYTPKGSLRPLGLLLFLKIAQLVRPDLDETKFAAMFEIYVLEPGISDDNFNKVRSDFMNGELDEEKQSFVLRQRMVNVE